MNLDGLQSLVRASRGRPAYVAAFAFSPRELAERVKSGILKPSNRFAPKMKCPCGGAHLADVVVRDAPGGVRCFAACDAYARMENYPVDPEAARLYRINARMLEDEWNKAHGPSKEGRKKKRAERKSVADKRAVLIATLKERAFGMLGLSDADRQKLMDELTGHFLHLQTNIRESTIGKLIDLKATLSSGKKELDNLLQLLYLACKNEAVFLFFSEQVRSSQQVWRNKSDDELYHLLKSALENALKRHKAERRHD